MDLNLKDKIIIVTGGAKGIGESIVRVLSAEGAIPVIFGRNEADNNKLIKEIGKGSQVKTELSNPDECINAVNSVIQKYGRIDGLVNGAGGNMPQGVIQPDQDVFDMSIEGLKNVLDLNLWGTIIPTKILGAVMAKGGSGSIVNISSVSSKQMVTKVLGYSIGKAGVDCFTKWMAVEIANRHGDKIRINSIMPGFFLTEQNRTLLTNPDGTYTERGGLVIKNTPFKRMGKPEELVGALIYLLSDASKFVNGIDLGVDGGFTIFSGV
jgi:NAD(P)-dependent dehydrogenase (short-subunit alcohol dehydrogenase family)